MREVSLILKWYGMWWSELHLHCLLDDHAVVVCSCWLKQVPFSRKQHNILTVNSVSSFLADYTSSTLDWFLDHSPCYWASCI